MNLTGLNYRDLYYGIQGCMGSGFALGSALSNPSCLACFVHGALARVGFQPNVLQVGLSSHLRKTGPVQPVLGRLLNLYFCLSASGSTVFREYSVQGA